MIKNKAFKFRIYPNKKQEEFLRQCMGCSRFVFNHFLSLSKETYEKEHKVLRYNDYAKMLNDLKIEYPFLKDVDSISLQQSLRHLDISFKNSFKYKKGLPQFKKKSKHKDSYTTMNVNNNMSIIDDKHLKLPKLGIVKAKIHRNIPNDYKLKSATLSETPSGKYFVSLLFEYYEEEININIDENKILGLDYSMKELFVTDDMIKVNDKYLRLYRKSEERLHFLQRALCRRQRPNHKKRIKSSKRYEILRKQIATLFEHMKNIRLDYYNKLSKEITNLYDIVVVEDINMQEMAVLSEYNSKATYDNGFGIFRRLLKTKLEEKGKKYIVVGKYYPSSKICNVCGYKNDTLTIDERVWECPNCHRVHNRDINASINLKQEGLRIYKVNK